MGGLVRLFGCFGGRDSDIECAVGGRLSDLAEGKEGNRRVCCLDLCQADNRSVQVSTTLHKPSQKTTCSGCVRRPPS